MSLSPYYKKKQPLSDEQQFIANVKRWRIDPAFWVECIFGDNIKLSNQQTDACNEMGKLIAAKIALSVGRELEGEQLRYSKMIGIDISSGMGLGKDFWLSLMILYFLHVFPVENGQAPRVLATANTAKQLSNVLWCQISVLPAMSKKLPNSNKTILEEVFVCQKEKIYRKEFGGNSFFAEAVTVSPHASSDEQSRALTGRHAPYMLMGLDEAAGLPDAIFENLEGTLTGRVNLIVMIYNPIRSRGYAVEARENPKRWLHMNWNAEDAVFGNPTYDIPIQNRNRDLLTRYGRESNAYRIRVLGVPPIMGTDVYFPWDWIQDAVNKGLEPDDDDVVVMGVDPAAGGDNSIIVVRHGPKIVHIERFNEPDTMRFVEKVVSAYYAWEPVSINVDCIGVGKGVYDRLLQLKLPAYSTDVRRTSRDRKRFRLVRDELWGILRDRFEKGLIDIPNDQRLVDQLGSITIKDYAYSGVMKIPTKAQMRKDIGHSPDEADGICLTYAIPDEQLLLLANGGVEDDDEWGNIDLQRDSITGY